ncbi:MAG: helix-turn-helix domain-containing protein [Rivularia sp. (in: Bacteria)]|nr:helix-turn-helix domain-containing protein [Rivularia sp. MS3]
MKVGTKEAAKLLQICVQRVRQLLKEGRIEGAEKVDRFWEIPLCDGKPKVTDGTRGPKPNWKKRVSKALTRICVNQHLIRSNSKHGTNKPVIRVESRGIIRYFHNLEIDGICKLIYRPDKPLSCGAKLWMEVASDVMIVPII